ncbi:MAG: phosphoribosyltransferase family protein [Legionellaceae bacterium]|nr:phosphoribosyltransferase family protein [Legionellaceae bacterium]
MNLEQALAQINQNLDDVQTDIKRVKKTLRERNLVRAGVGQRILEKLESITDSEGNQLSKAYMLQKVEALADRLVAAHKAEEASEADEDYQSVPPVLVALLNGAFVFAGWLNDALARRGFPVEFTTMKVSSYVGTASGKLSVESDFNYPVGERKVWIVDDLIDTGKTTDAVSVLMREVLGAASTKTIVMVDKKGVRLNADGEEINPPDEAAFKAEKHFYVGAGMDFEDMLRYLKDGDLKALVGDIPKLIEEGVLPSKDEWAALNSIGPLNTKLQALLMREKILLKQQSWCQLRMEAQLGGLDDAYISQADGSSLASKTVYVSQANGSFLRVLATENQHVFVEDAVSHLGPK